MGKKKMKQRFLIVVLVFLNFMAFGQETNSNQLKWIKCDTNSSTTLLIGDSIIEWAKNQLPFSNAYSKLINIGIDCYNIISVTGCSGFPCQNFYLFKKEDKGWKCLIYTNVRLRSEIEIEIDLDLKSLFFRANKILVGELSFSDFHDH